MSVKMDVQMTPRAMYDFLLYHTYSHLSGLIGAIFGVVVLGLGIRAMAQGDYTAGMMFFFFAAVFLVMTPLTLKSKAKAQVKTRNHYFPGRSADRGEMGRISEGSFYEPDIDSLYHAGTCACFSEGSARRAVYSSCADDLNTYGAGESEDPSGTVRGKRKENYGNRDKKSEGDV